MDYMRELLSTFCSDPDEIEARAFLAFSLVLGNHLLTIQHGTHTRNEVLARAAKVLLDAPSRQTRP